MNFFISASVTPGAAAAPPAGAFPTVAALLRTLGVAWGEEGISEISFDSVIKAKVSVQNTKLTIKVLFQKKVRGCKQS